MVARREREILEHTVRTVAEQTVKADELVDKAKAAGGGDHPVTIHAKMLRLELLRVKADLERELEDFVLNCSKCGLDVHWVSGLGVTPGHWAHREPAPPYEGTSTNPLEPGKPIDFSTTQAAKQNKSLLDSLEIQPDFAVRRGQVANRGWKLGDGALKSLRKGQRPITAKDLIPDMEQKGVDLRIGLDIATIALRRVVSTLVLVSGDSDLVPAMKFARTEGLKVEALGNPIRQELRAHADVIL
jgi:NYN domain